MAITVRAYNKEKDYELVGDFFVRTYQSGGKYPNWLQPRWEYMHYHPYLFKQGMDKQLHKIGIWEEEEQIVAVANFEHELGEVFIHVLKGYEYLKEEIFNYAEKHLYKTTDDGKGYLKIYINDFDVELLEIAKTRGYTKKEDYPQHNSISEFIIPEQFPEISLPEGYTLKSLEDENNLYRINKVLWRGFNHPGEAPETEIEGRKLMQSAPNFNKSITIVVEAPNGDYGSFCGMWYDSINRVAYVEPVATDPDYRRMGLGKAVVLEGIRRCAELGATVAFVESSQNFYLDMGFKTVFTRFPWIKEFDI